MLVRTWGRPGLLAAVVFLGMLGPPVAASAGAVGASSADPPAAGSPHFNVGATHSPQLLRQLAASAGSASGGFRLAAVPSGPEGAVPGVDVAAFQHPNGAPINWSQVAGSGVQFAAIKATEGNYYINPDYVGDLTGASAAGLSVLGYAFANPKAGNGTAAQQAQYLVTNAGTVGGRTPPLMLDIEYNPYKGGECYGLTPAAMVTWLQNFNATIKALTGQLPLLYTTADWWAKCTAGSMAFAASPVWVAAYTTAASPPLPAGWKNWGLWQYSSAGTVPGIASAGTTDLDALNLVAPGPQKEGVGQPLSVPVSQVVAGATTGFGYAATGLPAGLAATPGGVIAGTPTATDTAQSSTVTAAAEGAVLGSIGVTWDVTAAIDVMPPPSQQTTAGSPVDITVPAAQAPGGQAATFTVTGLPPGLTGSPGGEIAGWPDQTGTYQVTLTATDASHDIGKATFSWTVTAAADHGRVGPVRSAVGRRCLNDPNPSATTGTRIGVVSCHSRDAQRWALAQDGTLRIGGRCLSVIGSAGVGAAADLAGCSSLSRERWTVRTGGELTNGAAGLCLTAPQPGRGTAARIERCAGLASQVWTLPPGPFVSQIPGGCLDDPGNNTARHTRLQVRPCNGSGEQNWTAGSGRAVQINGRCLQAWQSGTPGARPVELDPCNGGPAQRWTISPGGTGMQLRNPASGLCLTDPATPGSTFAAHPVAVTGYCSASKTQTSWQFR